MYTAEDINILKDLIVEIVEPDRIILFGSYAYGVPNEKSDLDLLVIKNGDMSDITMEEEVQYKVKLFRKRQQMKFKVNCDVFCRTEKQIEEQIKNVGGSFVDAMNKGVLIYERYNN